MDKIEIETKAVAYVRMSTDHQKYSTANQLDTIRKYAEANHLDLLEIFSDDGRSGVQLKGRDETIRLFEIIQNRKAYFKHLLVYDVSRWGRYQNTDESAHYEYLCNLAGVKVHYCAEMFKNDGSLVSNVIKNMKRAMAGEYSRELSAKVFQGQCNLIRLGFRQGGAPGFGLRRMLVDENRIPKGILERGQHKSIQTDRVIQVLGPKEEVEVVRDIYRMFVEQNMREREIVRILNERNIRTDFDREWTAASVLQILTNEKYIGNNVFNKSSHKLTEAQPNEPRKTRKTDESEWIKAENVFPAIIDKDTFLIAKGMIKARNTHYSNEKLLEMLSNLFKRHGKVSGILIDETDEMPSSAVYYNRFGSLLRAYTLIGYTPETDFSYIEINKKIRAMHADVLDLIQNSLVTEGASVQLDSKFDSIRWINGEVKLSLILCRCKRLQSGSARWHVRLERACEPDFTIVARLSTDNLTIRDYYLFSRFDIELLDTNIQDSNNTFMEMFRYDNIDWFYEIFARTQIREIA